jgi:hypothetical protein
MQAQKLYFYIKIKVAESETDWRSHREELQKKESFRPKRLKNEAQLAAIIPLILPYPCILPPLF